MSEKTYYAAPGNAVIHAPPPKRNDDGSTTHSLRLPVCTVTEYFIASDIAAALNRAALADEMAEVLTAVADDAESGQCEMDVIAVARAILAKYKETQS